MPATQVKLEVIEDRPKGHVIDQVDFISNTTKYPCPFEYWLDTARIKSNIYYKLEAIITDHKLPARKRNHIKHKNIIVQTKSTEPERFQIDPTVDTEINNYKIFVVDA